MVLGGCCLKMSLLSNAGLEVVGENDFATMGGRFISLPNYNEGSPNSKQVIRVNTIFTTSPTSTYSQPHALTTSPNSTYSQALLTKQSFSPLPHLLSQKIVQKTRTSQDVYRHRVVTFCTGTPYLLPLLLFKLQIWNMFWKMISSTAKTHILINIILWSAKEHGIHFTFTKNTFQN